MAPPEVPLSATTSTSSGRLAEQVLKYARRERRVTAASLAGDRDPTTSWDSHDTHPFCLLALFAIDLVSIVLSAADGTTKNTSSALHMARPPLMSRTWPVMKPAACDAR